jgi:hypothetical protein
MFPTREAVLSPMGILSLDNATKLVGIDLIHELGENSLTKVHASTDPK